MKYNTNRISRPVEISAYNQQWPLEYNELQKVLKSCLGNFFDRIDHIGSTAIIGLCAKNVIDIQISIKNWNDETEFQKRMESIGYIRRPGDQYDHVPLSAMQTEKEQWKKWNYREPSGEKRTHIHVRMTGNQNQIFALLFRDFLRSNDQWRDIYGQVKIRLAELFPNSIDSYLYIKDPFVDAVILAAKTWATETNWKANEKEKP